MATAINPTSGLTHLAHAALSLLAAHGAMATENLTNALNVTPERFAMIVDELWVGDFVRSNRRLNLASGSDTTVYTVSDKGRATVEGR